MGRLLDSDTVKKALCDAVDDISRGYIAVYGIEEDDIQGIIDSVPFVQPEPQWIPVTERLPEEDDYKSCIECLDGAVWYFTENGTMGLGYYYKSVKKWSTTDDLKTDGKVVAWMPLPEPYREEGGK